MKQLYLYPIAQLNRSKKMNGLIEQWRKQNGSGSFTWNLSVTMSTSDYFVLCNGGADRTATTVTCGDTNPGSPYKIYNDCLVIGY